MPFRTSNNFKIYIPAKQMSSFPLERRDKDEKHVDLRLILNYNNKKEAKLTLAQRWSYVRKKR